MKLFKSLIISAIIPISSIVGLHAQKASVETASLSLRTYEKKDESIDIRIHSLNEAKKHVDMAVENSTTSNDPKMWLMRARTYLAIQTDTLGEGKKPIISDPEAIETAVISMVNCHKSDDKKKYVETGDAYTAFVNIAVNARFIADVAYNKKDYERSIRYYKHISSLIPYDDQNLLKRQNISDDVLLFNVATTEKLAKEYEAAKKDFLELIKRKYNDPWVYLELYDIYLNVDSDTNNAIKTVDAGRAMFEDNVNLRKQQIYIYSVTGRSDELIKILDNNIELDPYNANNYYLRAIMFSEMNMVEKAEADYIKALEYDDQLIGAYEDLGKLYYNKGAAIAEEANKLSFKETEKFNKMNEEVKGYFLKAIPNFEKIYEYTTDAKQKNQAAQVLMSMYLKTEQMDKYKSLKADFGQ